MISQALFGVTYILCSLWRVNRRQVCLGLHSLVLWVGTIFVQLQERILEKDQVCLLKGQRWNLKWDTEGRLSQIYQVIESVLSANKGFTSSRD